MNVDTDNAEEAMCMFEAAVPSAAFIAIDLEMTGITLNSNPFTKISASDTPDVRYGKMQKVASQYGIAQWGVCLFAEGQDSSGSGKRTYEVRPFNFYCFPRAHNDSFSQQLLIDSSSMDFLRSHSFDFGRWMSKGISYLDAAGERNLAESLFPTPQQLDPLDMPGRPQHKIELTRQDDISYLANVMESVGAMLQSGAKELVLPNCNTFLARAVRETIEARFPHLIVETRPGKSRWIPQRVVLNLTVEEKQEREERDKAAKRKVFREQVGLRRVWKMICKSRKPVVVHNGLYDLLFLYHRMEAPLPDGAAAFKKAKAALLPTTYDTKLLASHHPDKQFDSTGLEDLTEQLAERSSLPVEFVMAEGFDTYRADAGNAKFHEAGYDAYVTGRLFAYFMADPGIPDVSVHANYLHLMRSLWDFNTNVEGDLVGEDRLILDTDKGIILWLHGFEHAFNNTDFQRYFSDISGEAGDALKPQFRWIDQSSMLFVVPGGRAVTLDGGEGLETALREGLAKRGIGVDSLQDFVDRQKRQSRGGSSEGGEGGERPSKVLKTADSA